MQWNFDDIKAQAQQEVTQITNAKDLEAFRIRYLGKKGLIPKIFATLAQLPVEQKPLFGQQVNALRSNITELLEQHKVKLTAQGQVQNKKQTDYSLPAEWHSSPGHQHLLQQTIQDICKIFQGMGFTLQDGPEMEGEFYNFTALNIPENHPSRDGFDTFYLDVNDPDDATKKQLLRSHTSPGQIRIMQDHQPPLAVLIPGKVYRPDAVDASHSFMFHQIEGLLVNQQVSFSELKGLLRVFCQRFFGDDIEMRFRPHYFPFTEPSAEVDILWKKGKSKWLEIMGCGMVHPHVFDHVGYRKGQWTGLAFGMGVERIAMLKHGITDIRVFFENDKRFLTQF